MFSFLKQSATSLVLLFAFSLFAQPVWADTAPDPGATDPSQNALASSPFGIMDVTGEASESVITFSATLKNTTASVLQVRTGADFYPVSEDLVIGGRALYSAGMGEVISLDPMSERSITVTTPLPMLPTGQYRVVFGVAEDRATKTLVSRQALIVDIHSEKILRLKNCRLGETTLDQFSIKVPAGELIRSQVICRADISGAEIIAGTVIIRLADRKYDTGTVIGTAKGEVKNGEEVMIPVAVPETPGAYDLAVITDRGPSVQTRLVLSGRGGKIETLSELSGPLKSGEKFPFQATVRRFNDEPVLVQASLTSIKKSCAEPLELSVTRNEVMGDMAVATDCHEPVLTVMLKTASGTVLDTVTRTVNVTAGTTAKDLAKSGGTPSQWHINWGIVLAIILFGALIVSLAYRRVRLAGPLLFVLMAVSVFGSQVPRAQAVAWNLWSTACPLCVSDGIRLEINPMKTTFSPGEEIKLHITLTPDDFASGSLSPFVTLRNEATGQSSGDLFPGTYPMADYDLLDVSTGVLAPVAPGTFTIRINGGMGGYAYGSGGSPPAFFQSGLMVTSPPPPTPLPNLNVWYDPVPSFTTSDTVSFTGFVYNSPAAAVSEAGRASIDIDWNRDGSFTTYDAHDGTKLGAMSADDNKLIGGPSPSITSPPAGSHRFRFNADTLGEVAESDEGDNTGVWMNFTVTAPSVATASLTITPSSADYLTPITFTLSSTNAQSCEVEEEVVATGDKRIVFDKNDNRTSGLLAGVRPDVGLYHYATRCWTGPNGTGVVSTTDSDGLLISCPVGTVWSTSPLGCFAPPTATITAAGPVAMEDQSLWERVVGWVTGRDHVALATHGDTIITVGENVRLDWSSTNADSCVISSSYPGWVGTSSVNGSQRLGNMSPTGTYNFTITCRKAGFTDVSHSATVLVNPTRQDGICSSPPIHYNCQSGVSRQDGDTPTQYNWTCLGTGGSPVNAPCFESRGGGGPNPPSAGTFTAIPGVCDSGTINISWDPVLGATDYELERDGSIINTGAATTYVHSGLVVSSAHSYRVRAHNAAGYSSWTGPINTTAPNTCVTTTWTITASAGAGGFISPSGSVSVVQGSNQRFDIVENFPFVIDRVLVDGASVGSPSSYTFTNVTGNHTINVSFVRGSTSGITQAQGCVISSGQSDCTGRVGWTTSNPDGMVEVSVSGTSFYSNNENANNQPVTLDFGTHTVTLKDQGAIFETAPITAICFGTLLWSQGICQNSGGSISASPATCTIPIGQSTCNSNFTWSSTNLTNPKVFNSTTSTLYSTARSGNAQPYPVTFGLNRVWLRDDSGDRDFVSVRGVCAAGSGWNGSLCDPAAALYTITASNGAGGSISPRGAISVASGANSTFIVTPDATHVIRDVEVDGVSMGTIGSYTFSNVTANHTIRALFAVSTGRTIDFTNSGPIPSGTQAILSYTVTGWDLCEITRRPAGTPLGGQFSGNLGAGGRFSDTLIADQAYRLRCWIVAPFEQATRDTTVVVTGGGTTTLSAPANCTIAAGAASCPVTVNWGNATNANSIKLTYSNTIGTTYNSTRVISSATTGSALVDIYQGSNNILWNDIGGAVANPSFFITGNCIAGSTWNGTVCDMVPTGQITSITPANCDIPIGDALCSVQVSWTTSNATNPLVESSRTGTNVFSAGPVTWTFGLMYGLNTFTLRDTGLGITYDTKDATANCIAGSAWNGSMCAPLPVTDLKINGSDGPLTLTPGTITLTWSSTASATSCDAVGPGWSGTKGASGSETTPTTPGINDYSIACTNALGTGPTDTVRVTLSCTPSVTGWSACGPPCAGGNGERTRTRTNATCNTSVERESCAASVCRDLNWKEVGQ